jgi:succinate dehydrogenase / fumarate reductase cytochrome b subunit
MYLENQQARPTGYQVKKWAGHTSRKSVGSSTMIVSGLITVALVVIHLQQFKFGAWYETAGANPVRDLYRTEAEVFANPVWVAVYIIWMAFIFLHLRHGIASAFQSLGASENMGRHMLRVGLVVAVIIGGGFAIIPLIVYFTQ